jgi:hypothetical protein
MVSRIGIFIRNRGVVEDAEIYETEDSNCEIIAVFDASHYTYDHETDSEVALAKTVAAEKAARVMDSR